MKSHSVKSNAKRAARKLCETHGGLNVAEPVAAPGGGWFAAVSVAPGAPANCVVPDGFVVIPADGASNPQGVTSEELAAIDPINPGLAEALAGRITVPVEWPPAAGEPVEPPTADEVAAVLAPFVGKLVTESTSSEMADALTEAFPALADEPVEVPAFLRREYTVTVDEPAGEVEVTGAGTDTGAVGAEVYAGPTATITKTQAVGKSTALPADILATLPPPKVSTPEEIAARRAERRQRIEAEKANPTPKAVAAPKATKAQALIDLASRPEGATNAEMQAATGWQAHTLRGYIAGTLRKQGHAFRLAKRADGSKAYHCDPA